VPESASRLSGVWRHFEPRRGILFAVNIGVPLLIGVLLGETSAASRLVTNLARYPGLQWYLNLGGRLNLDSGWGVEASFSENIAEQQATTDFGIQLGIVKR